MNATISGPSNDSEDSFVEHVDEIEGESVVVEFPDDGTRCQHCNEVISDYGADGWQGDDSGSRDCPEHTEECEDCGGIGYLSYDADGGIGPALTSAMAAGVAEDCPKCDRGTVNLGHEPSDAATVDTFANSAGIHVSNDGTELTVTISVGDPRGAFGMTVRKLPDGRLILHVPHADMTMPHRDLAELHPGTFEIK